MLILAPHFHSALSDTADTALGVKRKSQSIPNLRVPRHLLRHGDCSPQFAAAGFSVPLAPRHLCLSAGQA